MIESNGSGDNMNNAFVDRPISRLHKFYLVGDIKPATEYVGWFEQIRNSSDTDVVMLHINSYGGDLFTAIQFLRVLSETKATVVASVEGACMSAATIIFMAAKHFEISSHSMFMFHNYSGVSLGKGGEMYDNVIHQRKWSENLWKDVYAGFLTDVEITAMLHNKDIWMTGEEVTKRLVEKLGRDVGVPTPAPEGLEIPVKRKPKAMVAKTTVKTKKRK